MVGFSPSEPSNPQPRQTPDNPHRLQTDRNYPHKQFQRIARILHGIHRPVVGVVDDATAFDVLTYGHRMHLVKL